MNKQIKLLLAGISALVILGVGVYFATQMKSDAPDPYAVTKIALFSAKKEDIKSINVKQGQIALDIEVNNEDIKIGNIPSEYIDEESTQKLFDGLANMVANKKFDTPKEEIDYIMYGFKNPWSEVTVKLNDGKEEKIVFGVEAPENEGRYALYNDTLYIVHTYLCNDISQKSLDYVSKNVTTDLPDEEEISSIKLEQNGQIIDLTYMPSESVKTESSSENTAEIPHYYSMTSPVESNIDYENVMNFAKYIYGMKAETVASLDLNNDNVYFYGLNEPDSKITATLTNGETISISIKNYKGFNYVKTDKKPIIYSVGENAIPWFNLTAEHLIGSIFGDIKPEDVTFIDLSYENETYSIANMELEWFLGENKIEKNEYDDIVNILLKMPIAFNKDEVDIEKDGIATATLKYKDGKSDEVKFISNGEGLLYVVLNGECKYLTTDAMLLSYIDSFKK